jgi:hypothetical protein
MFVSVLAAKQIWPLMRLLIRFDPKQGRGKMETIISINLNIDVCMMKFISRITQFYAFKANFYVDSYRFIKGTPIF